MLLVSMTTTKNITFNLRSKFIFVYANYSWVIWLLPYNQWIQQLHVTLPNYNEIHIFSIPQPGYSNKFRTQALLHFIHPLNSYNENNND